MDKSEKAKNVAKTIAFGTVSLSVGAVVQNAVKALSIMPFGLNGVLMSIGAFVIAGIASHQAENYIEGVVDDVMNLAESITEATTTTK